MREGKGGTIRIGSVGAFGDEVVKQAVIFEMVGDVEMVSSRNFCDCGYWI